MNGYPYPSSQGSNFPAGYGVSPQKPYHSAWFVNGITFSIIGSVIIFFLGWLYNLSLAIPLVDLNFLFTFVYGFICGGVLFFCERQFRSKNPLIAVVLVAFGSLLAIYSAWVWSVYDQMGVFVLDPFELMGNILDAIRSRAYKINNKILIKGAVLAFCYLVELLIIVLMVICMFVFMRQGSFFCDSCRNWCDDNGESPALNFGWSEENLCSVDAMLQMYLENPFAPHYKINLCECSICHCGAATVSHVTIKNPNTKEEEKVERVVFRHIPCSREQLQQLKNYWQGISDCSKPPPPPMIFPG